MRLLRDPAIVLGHSAATWSWRQFSSRLAVRGSGVDPPRQADVGAGRSTKTGNIVLPWRHDYDAEKHNRGDVHALRPPSYAASLSAATPSQVGGALRPDGVRLHSNNECNFSGSL
jgi:hypothetical protein